MAERDDSGHAAGQSEQPIIIKKIKKGGHGHHGGAWKVAYADFVTAMMAFFIVMWILASSEEVKQSVSEYFNSPSSFNIFTGQKTVPVSLFDAPATPKSGEGEGEGSAPDPDVWSFTASDGETQDTLGIDAKTLKAIQDSVAAAGMVEDVGNELKKEIDKMVQAASDNMLKNLLSSIEIDMTTEGTRIELIESDKNHFFEIGSATLKPEANTILRHIAMRIGRLSNSVEIEGHTDSRKYSSNTTYGNWELSADRANSARKILEGSGLYPGQISSVAGYADKKLRNAENPFDVSNRRISILIRNLSRQDFIDTYTTE